MNFQLAIEILEAIARISDTEQVNWTANKHWFKDYTLPQSVWPGMKYLPEENHLQNTFTWVAFEFFSITTLLWLMIPLQIQLPEFSLLTESKERLALSLSIFIPFWNHSYFVTGLGFDVAMVQFNV